LPVIGTYITYITRRACLDPKCGRCGDARVLSRGPLRDVNDRWKVARRAIVLDATCCSIKNLSVFL
jgi:hypothetical protein